MTLPLKYTEIGKEILEILNKESSILKMIHAIKLCKPPVSLLQEDLKEILDKTVICNELDKYKQFVGRSIRDILKEYGYINRDKKEVKTEGHFKSGALYIKK